MRGWRLLFAFVAVATLASCSWLRPLVVKNCAVRAQGPEDVELSVRLLNRTSKIVRTAYVMVDTKGIGENPSGGGAVDYKLEGAFVPGHWAHVRATKSVKSDLYTLDERLGAVVDCYANGAVFADGSYWEYSPM